MARTYTVAQLIEKIRDRGDWPTSSAKVTDALVMRHMDSVIPTLWGKLVLKIEDYYTLRVTFSSVAGQETYAVDTLAADFWKLRGVEVLRGGDFVPLSRIQFHERVAFQNGPLRAHVPGYRLEGASLFLSPAPAGVETFRLVYTPSAPKITSTAQTLEGFNGWEDLVVLETTARIKDSLDEPIGAKLAQALSALHDRIEAEADARDAGQPPTIVDVEYLDGFWQWL